MGMYTELCIRTNIKPEPEVVEIINYMLGKTGVLPKLPDHPLFRTVRWSYMLRSASSNFSPKCVALFEYDEIGSYYVLISVSNFKNYDDEVEKFFDWIDPYLDDPDDMIGYSRYESSRQPTIHFHKNSED